MVGQKKIKTAMLLILLGDGVVANVNLNKSGMKGAGAFVGACLVYILFKEQFDATEDKGSKLGVFCTGPSVGAIVAVVLYNAIPWA